MGQCQRCASAGGVCSHTRKSNKNSASAHPAPSRSPIRVTKKGIDLVSMKHQYDAHIRLEDGMISVDVFRWGVKDADKAHLNSDAFETAEDAEEFLMSYGFDERLEVKQ